MIKFKKVRILGVWFKVLFRPQRQVTALTPESPFTIGLMDGIDDNIHVSNDFRLHTQRRTFAHEWAHGIMEVNGLNQTLETTVAECLAQSSANALLELFEQKEVMLFLLDEKLINYLYLQSKKKKKK